MKRKITSKGSYEVEFFLCPFTLLRVKRAKPTWNPMFGSVDFTVFMGYPSAEQTHYDCPASDALRFKL